MPRTMRPLTPEELGNGEFVRVKVKCVCIGLRWNDKIVQGFREILDNGEEGDSFYVNRMRGVLCGGVYELTMP